jgi:uncharacterized UPF0160 family protein
LDIHEAKTYGYLFLLEFVMRIATHSGDFHADDIFGVMVLDSTLGNSSAEIVRTRDLAIIASCDAAVDVGDVWHPENLRFDHHQNGFEHKRPNGMPYASAGLVWVEYGKKFVADCAHELGIEADVLTIAKVAARVERDLVQYLDMVDNGVHVTCPGLYGLASLLAQMNVSFVDFAGKGKGGEDFSVRPEELSDARFLDAMKLVKTLVTGIVRTKLSEELSLDIVRKAPRVFDGKVMIIDQQNVEWKRVVHAEFPDLVYIVYPSGRDGEYRVRSVSVHPTSFENKLDLPISWAGLRGQELAGASGVNDAKFCHKNRFIGVAGSRSGAIEMARIALTEGGRV